MSTFRTDTKYIFLAVVAMIPVIVPGAILANPAADTNGFTTYSIDTAPEQSKPLLAEVEKQFGFVPNVLGQMAESPAALAGNLGMLNALGNSTLSRAEQAVVLLVVSQQCTAEYCIAANSTLALMMGAPERTVMALRGGSALQSPRFEALRKFSQALVEKRGQVSPEELKAFLDVGFSRAEVLDVLCAVSLETFASYTARALHPELDAQFQDMALK